MKKASRRISLGLVLSLVLMLFSPFFVRANGTTPTLSVNQDGEYIISSVKDINILRSDIDNGIDYSGKNVVLTQDIDISKSDVPLNSFTTTKTFNGTFNGKFHTISDYNDEKSGLFSLIDKDGVVENVRINTSVTIKNKKSIIRSVTFSNRCYGLIANENGGLIKGCSSTGTITNIDTACIGGISGCNTLNINRKNGKLMNCYSNIVFNNQLDESANVAPPSLAGICYDNNDSIAEHCYFYGKFTGNQLEESSVEPIAMVGDGHSAESCAYDADVLGIKDFYSHESAKSYTTAEMKNKDTYTALGFDFDKTWKIDSAVNDGYPYFSQESASKVLVKIPVDIEVTVADKTYDSSLSEDDNCKATVTKVEAANTKPETADLITKYNVKVDYTVKSAGFSITMGEGPVYVDFDKLKLTYDKNDDYEFVINKVLPTKGKFIDNGTPGPTDAKRTELIEQAKKAQNILYNKMEVGQGAVPEFTWYGQKATTPGTEGYIELNDYVWEVFSSARSGYTGVRKGFYDDWFKNIQAGLKKMKEAGVGPQDVKMTEWEKLVLAITAIGYDPRDIEAYDLIDIVSNNDYIKASKQFFTPQYAVYALNSYNYPIPRDGNHVDTEKLIHQWCKSALGSKGQDGSELQGNTVSDMWVMAFQPIASYYNPNAKEGDKYYDVKKAVEHVLGVFSNGQTYMGSFWSGKIDDKNNPWTNAQVYMTIGMAHENIFDKKYIKNGNSIFNAALAYYNFEEGTTVFGKETYDPTQMCRGLDSLIRAYEGRNNIFDCTDVKDSTVPVNNAIKALPENITSDNKVEVAAARALYDGLSDAKKSSIKDGVKAKLAGAEQKVNQNPKPTSSIEITNLNSGSTFKLGNDAKVSVKAVNNSDKDKDTLLVVALYDENNKFVSYSCGKNNIKKGDSSILTSIMNLPKEGTYKMKAFVCDSLENMNSISNVIDIPLESNK